MIVLRANGAHGHFARITDRMGLALEKINGSLREIRDLEQKIGEVSKAQGLRAVIDTRVSPNDSARVRRLINSVDLSHVIVDARTLSVRSKNTPFRRGYFCTSVDCLHTAACVFSRDQHLAWRCWNELGKMGGDCFFIFVYSDSRAKFPSSARVAAGRRLLSQL